jgi:hypothetical protein
LYRWIVTLSVFDRKVFYRKKKKEIEKEKEKEKRTSETCNSSPRLLYSGSYPQKPALI